MEVSAGVSSNVLSGHYTTAQEVTLTTTEATGEIYYTLDGTAPTSESTEYTEPIELATGTKTTIKAVTVTEGKDNSEVLILYITIQSLLLNEIKTWLGISHDKRDADILGSINYAKAELERVGIIKEKITETDPQIYEAIKVYSKYSFAIDDKIRTSFFESWQFQIDCLRRSKDYGYEVS